MAGMVLLVYKQDALLDASTESALHLVIVNVSKAIMG